MPNQCMGVLSSVRMADQQLTIRCSCVNCITSPATKEKGERFPMQHHTIPTLVAQLCMSWTCNNNLKSYDEVYPKMTGSMQLNILFCFCRVAASTQHAQHRTYMERCHLVDSSSAHAA